MAAITQLKTEQKLPISLEQAWEFLSSPSNLERITPSYMGFSIITSDLPSKMYPGMFISYKVSPLFKIPMSWVTEITHVNENHYFVDEQRVGPYAIWHHEHQLEEIEGGVLMKDILSYRLPFGLLGQIINSLFIKKKVKAIFAYREKALLELFGPFKNE